MLKSGFDAKGYRMAKRVDICRYLRNNKSGAAFVVVLCVLIVVSILAAAIGSMVSANLRMAKNQEDGLRAQYLALTGVDLGMAALIKGENESDKLLNQLFRESISDTSIQFTESSPLTDSVNIGDGKVEIQIFAKRISGERWVSIVSTGELLVPSLRRTTHMRFLAKNPSVVVRTKAP